MQSVDSPSERRGGEAGLREPVLQRQEQNRQQQQQQRLKQKTQKLASPESSDWTMAHNHGRRRCSEDSIQTGTDASSLSTAQLLNPAQIQSLNAVLQRTHDHQQQRQPQQQQQQQRQFSFAYDECSLNAPSNCSVNGAEGGSLERGAALASSTPRNSLLPPAKSFGGSQHEPQETRKRLSLPPLDSKSAEQSSESQTLTAECQQLFGRAPAGAPPKRPPPAPPLPHRPLKALSPSTADLIDSFAVSSPSSVFRTQNVMVPERSFTPRSRHAIVSSARNSSGTGAEPYYVGGRLSSCTSKCSILEFIKGAWKPSNQNQNSNIINEGDRLLVEFQAGLSLDEGKELEILEVIVLAHSSDCRVAVVGHEQVNFAFLGGSVLVNMYHVRRAFFEKKFHSLSMAGQAGRAALTIACTLKVVQGPPMSAKMSYIMREIQATVPRHSRVLVIGEGVRERLQLATGLSVLNLENLRHTSREATQVSGDCTQADTERILRENHFELVRELRRHQEDLAALCDECASLLKINENRAGKIREIRDALKRTKALKQLADETDRRLAMECYHSVQFIYGTIEDVRNCQSLVDSLEPAAGVVLDADLLTERELSIALSVRQTQIYLAVDTPFFWQRLREWRPSSKGSGSSSLFGRRAHYVSDEFFGRLEKFISAKLVAVELFTSRAPQADKGIGLLLSCFKHDLDSVPYKRLDNVVVLKHSERGDAAAELEANLMASIRKVFVMAGEHSHHSYTVFDSGTAVELRDSGLGDSGSQPARPRAKRTSAPYGFQHMHTFVSLHGLTAKALNQLYMLIYYTAQTVYLIGNIQQLKKTDEHVRRFVNNVEACGLVRKSLVLTCPKHKQQIIIAGGCSASPIGWQMLGCREVCDAPLACGHRCVQPCHSHDEQTFDEDVAESCRQKCARRLRCGHPCPLLCGRPCAESCEQLVEVRVACGHRAMVACHRRSASSKAVCSRPRCRRGHQEPDSCVSPSSSAGFRERRSSLFTRLLGST